MDEREVRLESADPAQRVEVGSRIGPYEVREHIGDGGMASVYKAWHTGLHRHEALKIPRHQYNYGPEAAFLQRLLAEARMAAQLHHPHIVAIHNVSNEDSELQYFAMDYVDGADLARVLEDRGRLASDEALPILSQVGAALDYAHQHGVVHRDIKPGNILLQSRGDSWTAKVVDFGISRAGEDNGNTRLTKSGMMVGTPEYMSPEQAGSGEPVDYRTDIYSLGIVAYEMLSGRPPFIAKEGVSRVSILMKHIREPPAPLLEVLPDLPPQVGESIIRALAKSPSDRYANCKQFTEDLEKAVAGQASTSFSGSLSPPSTFGGVAPAGDDRNTASVLRPASAPTVGLTGANATSVLPAATSAALIVAEHAAGAPSSPPATRFGRQSTVLAGLGGLVAGALLVFTMMHGEQREPLENAPTAIALPTPVAPPTHIAPPIHMALPTHLGMPNRGAPALQMLHVQKFEAVNAPLRTIASSTLLRGQHRISQPGKPGLREVDLTITYRNNKEILRRVTLDRIVRQSVPTIEFVGTRVPRSSRQPSWHKPIVDRHHYTWRDLLPEGSDRGYGRNGTN